MSTGKKITELVQKSAVRNSDLFIVADITDLVSYSIPFTIIKSDIISSIDFAKYDSNYTTTNTYSAAWNNVIDSTAGLSYGTLSLSGNVYAAYAGASYKVGIGTQTPVEKLTVVGNISALNKVYAGESTAAGDPDFTLVTKDYLQLTVQLIYPIGSIYQSTISTNPATILGFGTWVALAPGRVLVSSGTVYDGLTAQTFTAGVTGGEVKHKLSSTELPSHSHTYTGITQLTVKSTCNGAAGSNQAHYVYTGNCTTGAAGCAGGAQYHNNLQPYLVVYMWQRTA